MTKWKIDLKPGVAPILSAVAMFLGSGVAYAEDLDTAAVLTVFSSEQRGSYLQGVVEGLAYARYQKDGDEAGMQCIYKWFYDGDAGMVATLDAFERFPEHTPGALVAALIQKECPS